ncbi:immunity 70 family protein [Paenibacillus sp. YYML68]|uniref:immunity 70 family protein n=1 Tax=Paenibacillus sp. YYML68 TaxID=2909250 RepID=UPI002492290E|nr:immunity 70 family protein [Paenibacillus sp. YYML68]
MAVGFKVNFFWFPVGTGDFLHSFFSTISYHLESEGWGTRYPYLINQVYNGKLGSYDVANVRAELMEIRERLTEYSSSQVIWDIEDLSKQPPWGTNISKEITSLSNYFVTNDGKDLFDVFLEALNCASKYDFDLEIHIV